MGNMNSITISGVIKVVYFWDKGCALSVEVKNEYDSDGTFKISCVPKNQDYGEVKKNVNVGDLITVTGHLGSSGDDFVILLESYVIEKKRHF